MENPLLAKDHLTRCKNDLGGQPRRLSLGGLWWLTTCRGPSATKGLSPQDDRLREVKACVVQSVMGWARPQSRHWVRG